MTNLTSKEPLIIRKLKAILNANLGNEGFGVKELAREAGLSRSSLHRKVHAYNGNSTSQFIREFRLQKAMELLQEGEETVSEIAYRVGFSSPTYFNTCFKEYFGYPPGEAKLRDVSSVQDTGTANNPYPLVRTKDRITFLNRRLKRIKRWAVVFAIGIAISIAWATSYYINNNADKQVTSLGEVNEINSIAVLPFINLSGEPDLEYRSDGMTDAVISRLGFVENLKVTPFTSVLKYKSSDKDAPTIAKELGVQYILQGSFQLSQDKVKFTLHLINGPSNTLITSEDYIGAWQEDVFSMQTAVVEDLISQLNIDVKSEELLAIERDPTQNEEAYNYLLKAQYQVNKGSRKGLLNAISLNEQAIRLDSTFVEAYVHLAGLYFAGGANWGLFSEMEAWNKQKQLLEKAIELDNTNQKAKEAFHAGLYYYEWDFKTMEKNYHKYDLSALKLHYCLHTGRYEEALVTIEEMTKASCEGDIIDIEYCALMDTSKTGVLILLNRTEEALEILTENESLHSDNYLFLELASLNYFYMGELERAHALLLKIKESYTEEITRPAILWRIAACEYMKGNIGQAKAYMADLEDQYNMRSSGSPAWFASLYYASIGDYDLAFNWLQNSYDRHEMEMVWLRTEPALKPLRTDVRYLELYHKVGFQVPPITDFPVPPISD